MCITRALPLLTKCHASKIFCNFAIFDNSTEQSFLPDKSLDCVAQLRITDDKVDRGSVAFGDHGPTPVMDGNENVAEISIAVTDGIAVVHTGVFLCLFPVQAVFLIGITDILGKKQRGKR